MALGRANHSRASFGRESDDPRLLFGGERTHSAGVARILHAEGLGRVALAL